MRVLWLVAILGACTSPNPNYCDASKPCADGRYCDLDGAVDGTKNACIDVSCTPSAFARCDGDTALLCNSGGDGYNAIDCASGCADGEGCHECTPNTDSCVTGGLQHCDAAGHVAATDICALACLDSATPHCGYISPRYLPDGCDAPATMATVTLTSGTFDTSLDVNCSGGIITQTVGPEICVVHGGLVSIPENEVLRATGTRALALVADDALEISGQLYANASGTTNGPGGGTTMSGGAAGFGGTGGGGAGFKTPGGSGASPSAIGGGGVAGPQIVDPATLDEFIGGPSATKGGNHNSIHAGGGGGAVTLVSCHAAVSITGLVTLGGGGGGGGFDPAANINDATGGRGGGAGGYLVLQGVAITVTGSVYANGGAGGAG